MFARDPQQPADEMRCTAPVYTIVSLHPHFVMQGGRDPTSLHISMRYGYFRYSTNARFEGVIARSLDKREIATTAPVYASCLQVWLATLTLRYLLLLDVRC